ncbi:hypothetical protein [Anabaena sp. AL93]|jgi:hypothetical protein|uniref:hypothetical protein n=1 Tax=Anabaena sp. AL93 TaxID=1678133 RepID=UPI0025B9ED18|nr:hypothetical protein [Anabaena sp. AL93]MCX5981003.1 hypothetical protein [Nostocales cyanobacterium LacPavin_0920_SED1_MAG_38_18]
MVITNIQLDPKMRSLFTNIRLMRVKNIVVLSGFPEFSRTIIPESSTVLQGFQHLIHISRNIYQSQAQRYCQG